MTNYPSKNQRECNIRYKRQHKSNIKVKHLHKKFGGNWENAMIRSERKCEDCSIDNDQSQNKYGQDLCVHHKDLNKSNNDLSNLKVLCCACHVRTHGKIWVDELKPIFCKNCNKEFKRGSAVQIFCSINCKWHFHYKAKADLFKARYASKVKSIKPPTKGWKKKVVMLKDGETICRFNTLKQANLYLGVKDVHGGGLSNCLRGRKLTYMGYQWKYEEAT